MDVLNNPKYSYLIKKQPFYYKIFKTLFYYYSKTVFKIYTPVTVEGQEDQNRYVVKVLFNLSSEAEPQQLETYFERV